MPTKQNLLKKILRWLPVLVWGVVICFLSFSSLKDISIPTFFSADKIGHIGMYLTLELLFLIPLRWNSKGFQMATIIAIVFSFLTELVQHFFIENRFGELGDFVANLVGIGFAWLLLSRKNKT